MRLDAPCSALGTIPRHPEVKWAKRAADPQRLAATQLRLLARAAALLAPGGRIVYSTCSTEPEEGEEVIARFLASHPGIRVDRMGGSEAAAMGVRHVGELLTPDGYLRTWPHRHGIGGAFVALLGRALNRAHLRRCGPCVCLRRTGVRLSIRCVPRLASGPS